MEKQNLIITIGRQYGSGGAEVGKKLGQRMGLDVYDKEILKMTSDESGIRESYFHLADERAGKKLLYKIVQSLIPENTSPSTGSDLYPPTICSGSSPRSSGVWPRRNPVFSLAAAPTMCWREPSGW